MPKQCDHCTKGYGSEYDGLCKYCRKDLMPAYLLKQHNLYRNDGLTITDALRINPQYRQILKKESNIVLVISTPEGVFQYKGNESAGSYGDYSIHLFDGSETLGELLTRFSLEEVQQLVKIYFNK